MIVCIVSWAAVIASIVGNLMINSKKRSGFIVWMISNVLWVIANVMAVQINWAQVFLFILYFFINIHGWFNWGEQ